uniref:Methyltransferase domain-containing protein n=1 Tax=Chromera velia CCMP2878 TaxID=1169474 RepID=A0A0G4GSW1_9ALVE|eukprot:Cvel_23246.t1-p1 / transcript=Cvel_23246.t1 / gene=Cvel_23246 / organism=Chromera_velia_CCMP2878 / gene_product=Demethylmenaquinone methyltransferase, putative / transcript_product=Demethylmenaquinone methyltransferase, putative / location=Cvel_scaffold2375:18001-18864(-) / protein_length=288 / sequence_SO=supercontig / SO=protein_coding / is_pseudo=false
MGEIRKSETRDCEEWTAKNRRNWDERASFHLETEMYQGYVSKLRSPGGDALLPFDDRVLRDLRGLSVLHLQCHVGTDTLSLSKRGAKVTGVDFSKQAIEKAHELADEVGLEAEFVRGNVMALRETLSDREETYDLVYTSYGVLCWLSDLQIWGETISFFLRKGGRVIVIDSHPMSVGLDDTALMDDGRICIAFKYGNHGAELEENEYSYCGDRKMENTKSYQWSHSMADILMGLIKAGLRLDALYEDPEGFYPSASCMEKGRDGLYRLPEKWAGKLPLTFTFVASKQS